MKWYYYLHSNGDLIGKNPIVVDSDPEYFNSSFVQKYWLIDTTDRLNCWNFLLEATGLGANKERIKELSHKWELTLEDLPNYLIRTPNPTETQRKNLRKFIKEILNLNEEETFDKLEKMKPN